MVVLLTVIERFITQLKVIQGGPQSTGCTCKAELTTIASSIALVAKVTATINLTLQKLLSGGGQNPPPDLAGVIAELQALLECICPALARIAAALEAQPGDETPVYEPLPPLPDQGQDTPARWYQLGLDYLALYTSDFKASIPTV